MADFAEAARRRRSMFVLPRWTWIAAPALAATLIVALLGFGSPRGDRYADGALSNALESQLVASQRPDAHVRILLSFRDGSGHFCRGFSQASQAGIACRDENGWQLVKLLKGNPTPLTGEYRQAGSGEAEVLAAVQEMAAGPALDAEAETAAIRQGWRATNEKD